MVKLEEKLGKNLWRQLIGAVVDGKRTETQIKQNIIFLLCIWTTLIHSIVFFCSNSGEAYGGETWPCLVVTTMMPPNKTSFTSSNALVLLLLSRSVISSLSYSSLSLSLPFFNYWSFYWIWYMISKYCYCFFCDIWLVLFSLLCKKFDIFNEFFYDPLSLIEWLGTRVG